MVAASPNVIKATEVDEEKVLRLMKKIVKLEEVNSKTHEHADSAMIRKIAKAIEEEADCY